MPKRELTERDREARAAVALRIAGATYTEIADTIGHPDVRALRRMVEEEIGAASDDEEGRSRLRSEANLRLERLLRGVWSKATDPNDPDHLPAVRTATGLIDRIIKLHGLDAPAQITVYTPTQQELDTWVAGMVVQQTVDLPPEPDDLLSLEPADG
jgi:hypothetical protein